MSHLAIIGCGYVGFSLIKTFKSKFNIIGYDISETRINELKANYKFNNVIYTNNELDLQNCNIYIIAVPTNIKKDGSVNLEHIYSVKQMLQKYISPNDIIVLESSIYIGGTREIFSDFLKNNVYIGFSPERISPGDYEDCPNIPKIISGLNKISLVKIYDIYSQVIKYVIKVSSTETAELCKLYENCFRVVNIAYVNEIADLSQQYNINFDEVIKASATKPFGFMSFIPGFGIGGFCLPQNPYYLMHGLTNAPNSLPILYNSINYLNKRPLIKAEQFSKFNNILIIGLGFKKGQSLTAFSPTLKIYDELKNKNKNVTKLDETKNYQLSDL
ncbi:nucleotide sugar dehydrogenase, partial [bacterium]|nr:nucleotide sugar dehydrogenase [bacterium]